MIGQRPGVVLHRSIRAPARRSGSPGSARTATAAAPLSPRSRTSRRAAPRGRCPPLRRGRRAREPRARAQSTTQPTSSPATPLPRRSGATHMPTRNTVAGSLATKQLTIAVPSSPTKDACLSLGVARERQWPSENVDASSTVSRNASGASASARRRTSRKRSQSSAATWRITRQAFHGSAQCRGCRPRGSRSRDDGAVRELDHLPSGHLNRVAPAVAVDSNVVSHSAPSTSL